MFVSRLVLVFAMIFISVALLAEFPGNCLEFDGVDDYVSIPGDAALDNSQFTVEFWIQLNNPGEWQGIIDKGRNTNSDWFFLTGNTGNTEGVIFGVGDGTATEDVQYSWNDTEWHHVAGTYDGSVLKLYVDGELKGSDAKTISNTTNNITMGARRDQSWFSSGNLDEIRIWNSVRTQAEISDNRFVELFGNETNLEAYWKLDSSSGGTAFDAANGHDGILNNMTNDDWIASGVPLGTAFSGVISSNTVWDEHMLITGDVTINDGATLTIEPGVRVYFEGNYQIDVQGRIIAEGTASDSIKFTAHPTVSWNGIVFTNTPAANDSSKFVYCTLENGTDSSNGGAFSITNFDKILLENCTFQNNEANNGGAVFLYNASVVIKKCSFLDNSAQSGGAIYILNESAPLISRCIFTDNTATSFGGAIQIHHSGSPYTSIANIRNCLLINNQANYGGAISVSNSSPNITNCTITENYATTNGGALRVTSTPNPVVRNCVIYNNEAGVEGDQVYLAESANPDFYNCNIEGGSAEFAGTSFTGTYQDCIDLDPLFEDPDNDDYSLSLLSPCINGGDPTTTTIQAGNYDLAGNNRFYDNELTQGSIDEALDRIDIGAYERQVSANLVGILPHNFTISGYNYSSIDLHICAGFTVHMEPGTELRFHPDRGFDIEGNLIAIGEADSMITIRPHSFSTGFKGLNFTKDQLDPVEYSSTLEYCRIQGGFAPAYPDNQGGNIYSQIYDEINLINCIIEKGNAHSGGGIYAWQSDVNLINCVLNENQSDWEGGAGWFQLSQVNMINSTFADNSSDHDCGGVKFELGDVTQPQIVNSIFWNNGDEPILPNDGSLTDITYCNIETGFSGSGNISVDPNFTGETDHPYNIHKSSYCLNAGKQDTTGLNLPQYDLLGNERIYAHANSAFNRPDMGAYESQGTLAPDNFTASDGDNNFPGYVQLFWNYSDDYEPAPGNFRIYRDDININTLDAQTDSYSDYNVVPGQIYSYHVQAVAGSETRNSDENSGYIKPNGIISGKVLSANNNPVQDVKVSLNPSPGYCLEFDNSNPSSLTIENPEVNMDYNFTIEFWIKTSMNDVVLLQKGAHSFQVDPTNLVTYSDGMNTLTQQIDSLIVNDGNWHHLALVNDYANSCVKLYLDEYIVAEGSGFTFSGSSDSGFSISQDFSGFVDDLKIWLSARDSTQIAAGMYVVEAWDAPGLAGYWPMNEGNGNAIFDATNFAHNGSLSNCSWSASDPGIQLGAYTDAWGEYIISQIYYGSSNTFTVTPSKPDHLFQPEQRQVTLSSSNIAQNDIDFTDNSLIPITGYVTFQNTQCPVENAEILLNGTSSTPPAFTDDEGYYVMEVEHGTDCNLSVDYLEHVFNREWHLGVVTFPQTNINFEDTFTTEFRCEVVGGDDYYPIGEFAVTIESVSGCYSQQITSGSWASGGIDITTLPPLDFNVTVDPAGDDPFDLAVDDQFQSMKTQLISLTNPDSLLDTLRYVWKNDLQVSVSWPDTLQLYSFSDYPDHEFYVLPQNQWCEVEVQAFEDYSWTGHPNQITCLENCDLNIFDEVGTKGETQAALQDTTVYTYSFAPYIPNMLSGYNRQYQNMLEIRAEDTATNRMATQTDWVLIEGVKPTETTYSSTSPEIPFLILHDPPGDASFASFNTSSSHTTSLKASVCTNQSAGTNMAVQMGPDITYAAGTPFFSSEHKVDITNDYTLGLSVNLNQSISLEQSLTLTTSESYTTSADDQIVGDGADVFVGGAINLIWGVTHELSWDELEENVVIDTSLMVTPDGFATVYIYTDNQIRTTVIPNLYAIGDSTSAAYWQSYLDKNENNRNNAVNNPNHPGNISFNAGAGYSYEEQNTSVSAQSFEFTTTVSTEFGYHIGTVVDGIGTVNGYEFRAAITVGVATSSNYQTTTTSSFTLADDDETSTLNFLPDYFTIDIKKDPVYGTPVFDLLSGASSCHWEPNTQPRDGVSMSANTYSATGLQDGEEAAFLLQLGNTTQTNEYRSYELAIRQNTNPDGASIKINGVLLEGALSFSIPPGETSQAIMTVAQGPFAYEYEDLELLFYAPGDVGYPGPDGHDFWVIKSFDVYWEAPYSRVDIAQPQDNWILNQANNDLLELMFVDYDLSKENFKSIKLEYKQPAAVNWLPAFEIFRDSLLAHPNYLVTDWDVTAIPDGDYQIRAAATDSVLATYYCNYISGHIDRTSPAVLGNPEPADGILNSGDEISISFAENIDPDNINPNDISLTIIRTGQAVDFTYGCYDNKVILTPNIANYWLENETLEAEVSGLFDLYGNQIAAPVSWEFFVNSNPVYWDVTKIEMIKPLGESLDLTANLINSGGQTSTFNLDDLPTWLTVDTMSGTLLPLDSQSFVFSVSEQLGFGTFVDTIYADVTSLGREPLVFEISVLANPPVWSQQQLGFYDYSMNITGQLSINDEISSDLNDVIGAFILNDNGEYECRGCASIELVPYFDDAYQFFLTIHSNVDFGENIIFRVWDASDSKEYYGIDESYQFLAGSIHGTPIAPDVVHVSDDLIQTTSCYQGWNWISLNLNNQNSMLVDSLLSCLSPQENDLIKNQTEFAQFTTGMGWIGSLDTLNTTDMYKIKLSLDDDLEIIGQLENTQTTAIDYGSGWNWIGYLPHVSISVNEALADIDNLVTGDLIKDQHKFSQFIEGYGWFGSLLFMHPGAGYMLNTQNSGAFYYPDYVINTGDLEIEQTDEKLQMLTDYVTWQVDPLDFEYSANVTALIIDEGLPLSSENVLLGAFYGDECRGLATPIEVMGQWLFFLTIYSNTTNENITYKVYFMVTDEIKEIEETTQFVNNLILGNPTQPYEMNIIGDFLPAPQNITISVENDLVTLSWDAVPGADSYKIYSSDSPEIAPENWNLEQSDITGTSWSAAANENRMFFFVRAIKNE
ncbi:MAG: Ig-like domain-containing protein [Candidatus Cloacimonetes bacterium]|nr:Ig-like domain-containing protein [Candidatus Cloacimonadota bacterium]MCF7868780.1 Ig-like domain-containing protein [Candidatus Cloacimonadota bacterium]MCF7884210.1 Ig-like domain-containing protein [Candidatus Cloacimonadota bacterium]